MMTSRTLTIFEGPDGCGKSTAAADYAKITGAKLVHFSAMPHVTSGLARMYVEAMLPALLGYQNVVFDRSWLSERPYGYVFRDGTDRLGDATRRMLDRLAYRCGAVVVRCDLEADACIANWSKRRGSEMVRDETKMRQIIELYASEQSHLPTERWDYRRNMLGDLVRRVERARSPRHILQMQSAGNWNAPNVLVGEDFAERKNQDSFYQWPFASFNGLGCSQWLSDCLDGINVSEAELLWVNADQDLGPLKSSARTRNWIALGKVASDTLEERGIEHTVVPHPQYQRRFGKKLHYRLEEAIVLTGATNDNSLA